MSNFRKMQHFSMKTYVHEKLAVALFSSTDYISEAMKIKEIYKIKYCVLLFNLTEKYFLQISFLKG